MCRIVVHPQKISNDEWMNDKMRFPHQEPYIIVRWNKSIGSSSSYNSVNLYRWYVMVFLYLFYYGIFNRISWVFRFLS